MRKMEEIQRDYQVQTSLAGQTQYQIESLSKDLRKMNMKLRELNKEAMKLAEAQKASADAAKPVEAAVAEEAKS